jgi:hypothetical protein
MKTCKDPRQAKFEEWYEAEGKESFEYNGAFTLDDLKAAWAAAAATDRSELVEALKTARQALMEVDHAQRCGPDWYSKGSSGLYMQVRMWLNRGLEAVKVLDK